MTPMPPGNPYHEEEDELLEVLKSLSRKATPTPKPPQSQPKK